MTSFSSDSGSMNSLKAILHRNVTSLPQATDFPVVAACNYQEINRAFKVASDTIGKLLISDGPMMENQVGTNTSVFDRRQMDLLLA